MKRSRGAIEVAVGIVCRYTELEQHRQLEIELEWNIRSF